MAQFAGIDTELGFVAVAWSERGIRRIHLGEPSRAAGKRRLERELGPLTEAPPPASIARVLRQIERHLAGEPARFEDAPLDLTGVTPFCRRVYDALRQVPPGATVSYGELAERVGSPKAARAVGRAMATNPFLLIVPCHRVLARGGLAGGFSAPGGLDTKARLLAIEGVELRPTKTTGDSPPDVRQRHSLAVDPPPYDPLPYDRALACRTTA